MRCNDLIIIAQKKITNNMQTSRKNIGSINPDP